ncbi:hypothetical protein [Metabacillus arenae]|uniref:Uncharacterized protein n=1 Tax=Metabacillus arenae TaxID=2771434 RepID=A0A926NDH8_9BACI|nr:hypothetical protein [Metabacillus arenae]MBD1379241.1 hypothetical protein [Metabacillus arenae]
MDKEVLQRVSVLEERSESHKSRIETLEEKSSETTKLSTLMEMVIQTNEKQSDTLDKINENLTNLNGEMKNLGGRVETLEQNKKEIEHNKKEAKKEVRKITMDFVFKLVSGLVLAYLLVRFGWK